MRRARDDGGAGGVGEPRRFLLEETAAETFAVDTSTTGSQYAGDSRTLRSFGHSLDIEERQETSDLYAHIHE